ncbi:MAG: dienelactone hydrolase family protein [Acidimicrobiia bacterium]|nr:dienelactone hydrolase family protein [Acidimicrobiia bacterium]
MASLPSERHTDDGGDVAVLPHEGTYPVMYAPLPVSVGAGYRRGYLARPDQAGRFPTVILTPDLDGLGPHEKHVARRLARRGVAVLVVDPYVDAPSDREAALTAYHALADAEALRTIDETYDYLRSEDIDWAQTDRFGLLGLDVGGRFSLIAAAHRRWVGAAAVVSTPLTGDEERQYQVADLLRHIPVPVLGLYGMEDELVHPDSVDEAQNRNATGQWLLYENVGHGFLDEVGPEYDEAATEDAIARMVDFFTLHLPQKQETNLG